MTSYSAVNPQGIFAMLGFILLLYFAVLGIAVTQYILTSLALHKIAKRRQINYPWLAWIPFGSNWIVGSIADEYDAHNGIKRSWRIALLVFPIIGVVLYFMIYVSMFSTMMPIIIKYGNSSRIPDSVAFELLNAIWVYMILFIALMLVFMALQSLTAICQYKIYESTVPEKALKYMIISLLVPLGSAICLFICRNSGYDYLPPYDQMGNPQTPNMYNTYSEQNATYNSYQNPYN